jgi:uncharacterized cupin superfamily protein
VTVQTPDVVERPDAGAHGPFIHQVRRSGRSEPSAAGSDGALEVGVWRSGPATYDCFFADDEAFVVREGAAAQAHDLLRYARRNGYRREELIEIIQALP